MRIRPMLLACTLVFFGSIAIEMRGHLDASPALGPQDSSAVPSAASVVKTRTFVSLEPVPREREFQVAVVLDIARGYHINSHKPTDAYLIPTTLTAQLPSGFELEDSIYSKGQMVKFAFSPNHALDVYTGSVTLLLRLAAHADAPLGATEIPIMLRYQACNDTTCLPPVKLPVSAKLEIANKGAASREVHPEIFSRLVPAH
jgi:hypothetical protein